MAKNGDDKVDELEHAEPLEGDSGPPTEAGGQRCSAAAGLLVVLAGGFGGTILRVLVSNAVGSSRGLPAGIFLVNIAGAGVLGLLLESLARRGPDTGWRRLARLGLGTGVLGGFTTYSTLAVDAAALAGGRQLLASAAYSLAHRASLRDLQSRQTLT